MPHPLPRAALLARILVPLSAAALCAAGAGRAGSHTTAPSRYSVTALAHEGDSAEAYAMNDQGLVGGTVVYLDVDNFDLTTEAALWVNGTATLLPGLPGGDLAMVTGLNERGDAVGWGTNGEEAPFGGAVSRALLWRNGTVTDLGTLGGPSAEATAVNEAGQVVGFADTAEHTEYGEPVAHAFLWQNGTMVDLGTLVGGLYSQAGDINESGRVVGLSNVGPAHEGGFLFWHAVAWNGGPPAEDIGPEPQALSQAVKINASGTILATTQTSKRATTLLLRDNLPQDVGGLGGRSTQGTALNDTETVLGFSATAARGSLGNTDFQPFVWQGGRISPLAALVDGDVPARLDYLPAVNSSGRILAMSFDSGSVLTPLVLTPTVPDDGPPTLGVLSLPGAEVGGKEGKGQVFLSGSPDGPHASGGGLTVRLRSSNPKLLQVPRMLRVGAGRSSATFRYRTSRVKRLVEVNVTAIAGSVTRTVTLLLTPTAPSPA